MHAKKRFFLSSRSRSNLLDVNPFLVRIVEKAIQITEVDFAVIEGRRSPGRQLELFKAGKSQTLKSKHLTGDAVDLAAWVDGEVTWEWAYYVKIAQAMKEAARRLGYDNLVWGGDWKTFKDGVHFQIGR